MSGLANTVVVSFPSPLDAMGGGTSPNHDRLMPKQRESLRRLGEEWLRIADGAPLNRIIFPLQAPFPEAASIVLEESGMADQASILVQAHAGYDTIGERDDAYTKMTEGEGSQLMFLLPPVTRAIICGNTDFTRARAHDLLCAGMFMVGFETVIRKRRTDVFGGPPVIDSIASARLIAMGSDPNEFSLAKSSR